MRNCQEPLSAHQLRRMPIFQKQIGVTLDVFEISGDQDQAVGCGDGRKFAVSPRRDASQGCQSCALKAKPFRGFCVIGENG